MTSTVIVTTTINIPTFLEGICKNLKKYKYKNNSTKIIVISDLKTPKGAKKYCNNLVKKYGFEIIFMDLVFQNNFFKKKYKKIYSLFILNDATRKLLGSIYLFDNLPDRVIFIDDDNFVNKKEDFLKGHLLTNTKINSNIVSAKSKWPNLYKFFKEKNNIPLYPRGFPWKYRNYIANDIKIKKGISKVIANCGYILGDPDIDAVSRLFWPIETIGVKKKKHLCLNKNNFFPLNDQNTSLAKDYIPLYYKPLSAGRNSDIWTSYFIEKISFNFKETVSYGPPLLKQIRNKHDYWKDYELEKEHNIATDIFVDIINKIKIKNNNKLNASIQLCKAAIKIINLKFSKKQKNNITKVRHYQAITKKESNIRQTKSLKYISEYFKEYLIWLKEVKKLLKNKNVY